MTLSLLIVDDDALIRETLVEFFETFGHAVRGVASATDARRMAAENAPDVVLLDLRLPDADGVVTLEALRADDPDVEVILLTGYADVRTAVQAMQKGAADVLEKPVDLAVLSASVDRAAQRGQMQRELALLRSRVRARTTEAPAAGTADAPTHRSSTIQTATLDNLIDLAARNADAPVLLQGETGTGKGYVARLIHDRSSRNDHPFVDVNCATLSSTFLESELFGHERGAFTDAKQARRGLLELAGSGTVFLDEIAELGADVQPRLLKVIEERRFRRLGGTAVLSSDARVIGATHQPLAEAVAAMRFRADLFYRLQVLTITLPPLRARPDDIPALAHRFLPRGAALTAAALDAIQQYGWPGNIRELKNALWRASILADGRPIHPDHLGLTTPAPTPGAAGEQPWPAGASGSPVSMEDAERAVIRAALHATGGNRTRAAQRLGIARSTLLEKLRRFADL